MGTEDGQGLHLSISKASVTGGLSPMYTSSGSLTFVYNDWNHIALQYDGQNKIQVLYLNGEVDHVRNNISMTSSSSQLLLGRNGQTFFRGQADEVRLWNFPVNVTNLYNKYIDELKPQHLIRHYRFATGEGSWIKDSVTDSRKSRLHGDVAWITSSLELQNPV